MDEILLIGGTLLAGVLVWTWRWTLVTDHRLRALSIIYTHDDIVVSSVRFTSGPSHHDMMCDLSKWQFKQFYPWLVEDV